MKDVFKRDFELETVEQIQCRITSIYNKHENAKYNHGTNQLRDAVSKIETRVVLLRAKLSALGGG